MGGVINLIKKLFSGIFSFIGGILGGKKSSGYFMEYDEAQSVKPASTKEIAPEQAIKNGKSAAESVAKSVKETVVATEATVKSAVKSTKAEAAKAEPVKAETAAANGSTNGAKPPVAAETLNLPQPTVSFATEYLVPKPTNSRRRPGANMGAFLEMAKTAKTPNR